MSIEQVTILGGGSFGTSIANIFVGARQAFYAIIRNLLLSVIETDQAVVSLFEQIKMPPATMEELKAIFKKGPAMKTVPSPP